MKPKQESFSEIVAYVYVSESEVVKLAPEYTAKWEEQNLEQLEQILYSFGLNTKQPYRRYDGIPHRNKFNEVVVCSRWVGNERADKEWLDSGFASREAIDRSKNNKLLDNLYAQRGLTHSVQAVLEQRDSYEQGKGVNDQDSY